MMEAAAGPPSSGAEAGERTRSSETGRSLPARLSRSGPSPASPHLGCGGASASGRGDSPPCLCSRSHNTGNLARSRESGRRRRRLTSPAGRARPGSLSRAGRRLWGLPASGKGPPALSGAWKGREGAGKLQRSRAFFSQVAGP